MSHAVAASSDAPGAQPGEGGPQPTLPLQLAVVPIELTEANALVRSWHRHHDPVVGHRFSLGVVDQDGVLRGACIVGRPVARLAGHPRSVAEVTRLVTDGSPNACSMLYAAAARACRALGFERIQTYILMEESGTSLRASGWVDEGPTVPGGLWGNRAGDRKEAGRGKRRWTLRLNEARPPVVPLPTDDEPTLGLTA